MANFKFGKGKKGKDTRTESQDTELESKTQQRFNTVNDEDGNEEEDTFFGDDFGIVDKPSDEPDLEDEAVQYAYTNNDMPQYKKAEPKWYEKGANIIVVIVIITLTVVTGLFIFREPIREFVGSGTENIRDLDIQGEVSDYQTDVKDTLTSKKEDKEDAEKFDVKDVEFVPEGEYTVGKDMSSGIWVADKVLIEIYPNEEDYKNDKSPLATNVSSVDIQKIVTLTDGQFVVIKGGKLVFNKTRPEVAVNVGDTFINEKGTHVFVGKDIPEGFYTFYNLDILEKMETSKARGARISLMNATEDEKTDIGVERKTTVFLREGLILSFNRSLLGERVSSDGTYGDDKDFLDHMAQEDDNKDTKNGESK